MNQTKGEHAGAVKINACMCKQEHDTINSNQCDLYHGRICYPSLHTYMSLLHVPVQLLRIQPMRKCEERTGRELLELTLSLMVRPGIVADVTDFRLLVYNELKHGESDSNPILHSEIANPPASFSQPGNRQSSGTAAVISLSSRA